MTISRYSKIFLCLTLSLILSHIPHIAAAEVGQMISTTDAVQLLTRSEAEFKVRAHLENAELQEALKNYGLSAEEIQLRMASLSDSELSEMARQMDQARFGGESVTGILVTVLIVVLIIYLIKRI